MNRQAKASASCWEKLYCGLHNELASLPDEKVSIAPFRYYSFAIGYAFRQYKSQEEKANG